MGPSTPARRYTAPLLLTLTLLAACGSAAPPPTSPAGPRVAASASSSPLAQPAQPCSGAFVPHTLDYTTTSPSSPVQLYDSNGSGVAIGDIDADGDMDLALANLAGPSAVLWNQGRLRFERQELPVSQARTASIVDADGDGMLDVVLTRRNDKPALLRNTGAAGDARLALGQIPDVNNPLTTIAWADLDQDGDLDMVGASYDADLLKLQGLIFEQRGGVGVFVYTRDGAGFAQERLGTEADALALALPDLNGDGRRDIWVGNDFNRPDYVWLQGADGQGWQRTMPSDYISENTMSLDLGDVDNNGTQELFATDMKPLQKDTATMAKWLPMMKKLTKPLTSDDPQHAENTLQVRQADGTWRNEAYERMLDSSGWGWSGKFGDLDRDGSLDAYVVTGMIAAGLFDHLPGQELVEPNMAFRNTGSGGFELAPRWGLGSLASGRGMSMADMDGDGDLDIVVNNLQSPAQLFENRLCGGDSLLVELRQPGGNSRAIGALITLRTSAGTLTRDVRATSGYLSGDPPQIHFGVPAGATIQGMDIAWPDGSVSTVEGVQPQTALLVSR